MALSVTVLRAYLNLPDGADDALLTRLLAAATAHVERLLGFTLASIEGGAPADLEQAVCLLAGHWFENREASLVGVTAQVLPMGVAEIIAEHRKYTFGLCAEDEVDGE